ncbi:MAG: SDR family NAD(P)-dependent oxidoreductase [Bacteroidota bacterium]
MAHELERELRPAGFVFHHQLSLEGREHLDFNETLKSSSHPIILLLSDNYLKSISPMHQILGTFQELLGQGRLQCIVIDGWYPGEKPGTFDSVPTTFDRIGQIIKYMNFWQEKYLDMRHQSRSSANDLEEDLKIVRGISTQVGEFLRYLRDTSYWEYPLLQQSNFQAFFHRFGDEASFQAFSAQRVNQAVGQSGTDRPSTAKEVSTLSPTVDPPEEESMLEEEEIIIEQIPGMDLLHANVAPETGPSLDPPVPPAEAPPEKALHISPDLTKVDNLVQERLDADPPSETTPPVEELAGAGEEDITVDFGSDIDEIIEEVAEEEAQIQLETPSDPSTPPERNYAILESIFEEEEEEVIAPETEEADVDLERTEVEAPITVSPPAVPQPNPVPDQATAGESPQEQDVEKYLELAAQAESDNNLLLAKSYYEKVLSLSPDLPGINYKLGRLTATCFTNQQKQASNYFKRAIKLHPEHIDARYQYAVLLAEELGKPDKAVKHFHKTLELQADHPFANYDLALIHHRKGDLETATAFYERAFGINPELKTEENDLAFNYRDPEPEVTETPAAESTTEEQAIQLRPVAEDIKTVLITGATSGIGLATAQVFAERGHRIIMTGRRADRLEALQSQLQEHYQVETQTLCFDVRQRSSVSTALDELGADWSEIDILINNAGLARGFAAIHEGDIEDWETMIDTNIKGLLYMTRVVSPWMVARGRGHIINVASTAGKEVYPKGNVYCATKFAVDALTKSMRLDLHQHGIRVSQVAPGHVEETEFALVRFHGDTERAKIYEDFQPLKARDVAETIYFIATRPEHVNIQDVLMMGTQQASSNHIHRSGRQDG